jgi:hypothetical protein
MIKVRLYSGGQSKKGESLREIIIELLDLVLARSVSTVGDWSFWITEGFNPLAGLAPRFRRGWPANGLIIKPEVFLSSTDWLKK